MENSRSFSGNTMGNNATVNQGNVTHITVNTATSNADRSFLQEISKTNPVHDKKDILMRKGPLLQESCTWILDHEDFSRWRHTEETGVFWIKGDAGKGKTMLLCGIIEEFEKDSQNNNLAYFFCQAADYRTNTAAGVIGGLVFSLLKRHPALLLRTREKYEDGPKGQFDGANALAVLFDIFETIVQDLNLTGLTCVVDALDECINGCNHLLGLIIKTSNNIKWLLSSRNEKHIEKRLVEIPQTLVLELKQNAEHVSTSIDIYIDHHIREIKALQDDETLQSKTFNTLRSNAGGTFLWVALVIEQLHDTDHWRVEDVLEEIPKDLESIYGLIISRFDKLGRKGREACQVLLSIVTAAKRPLHLRELLVFLNSHWKGSEHFKTLYQLRDIRDMTKDCGAMLSIRDDIIYFIHQSAKDYIVEIAAQHIFPIQHQHYKMFETSLDAMSSVLTYDIYHLKDPGVHIDDIPQQSAESDPLASIRYCCVFWVEHLVHGYQFREFEHWKYFKDDQRLHSFLKEKFLCWAESLALMRSFIPHAQLAFRKLKNVIESYGGNEGGPVLQPTRQQKEHETQRLRQFVDDAYRFLICSGECVGYWPLQLYFSAIAFEPSNSVIRKIFEQTVRDKFGPSPTVLSISQRQSSLLLRTIHIPSSQDSLSFCTRLLFSPNSVFLCTLHSSIGGFGSSTLTFWRIETGYLERSIQFEENSMIAFFPDSKHLISISEEGNMKIWDIDNGSCIREQTLALNQDYTSISAHRENVIALSPNGDLVAMLCQLNYANIYAIKIWETKSASCSCTLTSSYIPCATFSPNSELLVLHMGGTILIHHTKTGQEIKRFDYDRHRHDWHWPCVEVCPIFSPDSRILVTARCAKKLYLWDTNTWTLLHQIETSREFQPSEIVQPTISPDSAILVACAGDRLKFWSIGTGKPTTRISKEIRHITFSPDWAKSSLMASNLDFNIIQIRIWQADISQNESELHEHDYYTFVNTIISPDSRFVASVHEYHNEISIYNGDNGQLIHALKGNYRRDDLFCYLQAFSLDSELLAFYWGPSISKIQIWRVVTGESICLIDTSDAFKVSSMAIDAKYLVAGCTGRKVLLWHIDSGHKWSVDLSSWMFEISSMVISPDSMRLAALVLTSEDTTGLRIWDLVTGECITGECITGECITGECVTGECVTGECTIGQCIGLCIVNNNDAEGKRDSSTASAILASVAGRDVLIWDVSTGACLRWFNAHCGRDLLSFNQISGQTFKGTFFDETPSWRHCETFSRRLGYSYTQGNYESGERMGAWILLGGKKNFYIPTEFREKRHWGHNGLAMSGSLLALVNELAGLVIIKLPTHGEPPQQAIEDLDPDIGLGIPTLKERDLNLDFAVLVTDDSHPKDAKRRRLV